MTKKHFEYAARIIRESDQSQTQRLYAASVIIELAETFNPRFDRDRFLKACGL